MRVFLILKEADILHGKESVPRPTELSFQNVNLQPCAYSED